MLLIKTGGGSGINIEGIVADLAELDEPFMIVHGANALRDEIAEKLGIEKKVLTSVSGYTSVYTDEDALDAIMMAYAGLRNKRIVELCNKHGVDAVGLSGIDGKLVQGRRNKGVRVKEGKKVRIVRDFSGKPQSINTELLELLLTNGYVPVLCIPINDEKNCAINSENDDIVGCIVDHIKIDSVIQLIEAPGFLENPDDPASVVEKMSPAELAHRESQVEGRMKRKMLALRNMFENGAGRVVIADGRTEHPVKDAIANKGTVIS